MSVVIRGAELIEAHLPLVRPFRTSSGVQNTREAVLLRVEATVDGRDSFGWSECAALPEPLYSPEWGRGAWILIRDVLLPLVARSPLESPSDIGLFLSPIRGNPMAKATVEGAVIDAILRARDVSLAQWLGATRSRVSCGVSVGLADSVESLIDQVAGYVEAGYRRIKLKIQPGDDVAWATAVRSHFSEIVLSVDANASYTPDADALAHVFKPLDSLGLSYIEQPFAEDDLRGHAWLADCLTTPLCLDESITSAARAVEAIEAGACSIVNVKQGRLGGLVESASTHAVCVARDAQLWCGGMLETGIGRAVNLALAAMPGFTLPGDTSASDRYFAQDLTEPFVLAPDGTMAVPTGPGIGVEPDPAILAQLTHRSELVAL